MVAAWGITLKTAAALVSSVCLAGCLYIDPINQRPSIDIRPASDAPVYRGDRILLRAEANDPEGQEVELRWAVYACTQAVAPYDCDELPMYTGRLAEAELVVPAFREAVDAEGLARPTQALRVMLDAIDDRGAAARPTQELALAVLSRAPSLELRKVSTHDQVLGTDYIIYAKYGDDDDPRDRLAVDWVVYPPTQTTIELTHIELADDPGDPKHRQEGKRLKLSAIGEWDVRVTVRDPAGNETTQTITLVVVADRPPCIGQVKPLVSGPGQPPLVVSSLDDEDAKRFEVSVVTDDLDAFPALPGDPVLGQTGFRWSILPPGATQRLPFGATNSVDLDPAAYPPGSVLELRVEITDRESPARPLTCTDAEPTCSLTADSCIQRQTWRVEVR